MRNVRVVVVLAALSGCGRGPGVVTTDTVQSVVVDQREARDEISDYRRQHGLGVVESDPALAALAVAQATAMAGRDELSHTVAGSLAARLAAADLRSRAADENVSGGYESLKAALGGWRRSPPHDANLLDPGMKRIGIGSAYAAQSKYHRYWALILTD